jgi:hypothetical protein
LCSIAAASLFSPDDHCTTSIDFHNYLHASTTLPQCFTYIIFLSLLPLPSGFPCPSPEL